MISAIRKNRKEAITKKVADAAQAQSAATSGIARNVEQAFSVVEEIAGNIQTVTANARDTERYAASTLEASGHLSSQSEQLAQHVRDYLGQVRPDLVEQTAA